MTCTDVGLSCQDTDDASALHFASRGGHCCILEKLLQVGSNIIKDYWGGIPLHDAAENEQLEAGNNLFHMSLKKPIKLTTQ